MPESTPSYNSVCATCHAAIGALIITLIVYLHTLPSAYEWFQAHYFLIAYAHLLLLTIVKEYVIDPAIEHDGLGWTDPDGVSASLQDFTWYWVGGVVAGLFLWLVH